MGKKKADVVWFNVPAGIVCGCAICRKILKEGTWAVGIIIDEHRYVVGVSPPVMCCGEEKKVIDVRDTEEAVRALAREVREQLNRDGTTAKLKLYERHFVFEGSNAIN